MGHDVFVSHSAKDKPTADAVCAMLESQGIRCWVAPRDIIPGKDWGESIVEAIKGARVMVLVFSTHANNSQQIKREVERAVSKGIPIIPLRIEDVVPTASLEYFLSTPHWLDAFAPPLEKHLRFLAQIIRQIIGGPSTEVLPAPTTGRESRDKAPGAAVAAPEPPLTMSRPVATPTPSAGKKSKRAWVATGILVVPVVILVVILGKWFGPTRPGLGQAPAPFQASQMSPANTASPAEAAAKSNQPVMEGAAPAKAALQVREPTITLPAAIVTFIGAEEKQADEIARQNDVKLRSDIATFFADARTGRVGEAQRIYAEIPESWASSAAGPQLDTRTREIVREVELSIEPFVEGSQDLALALGKDFMSALPQGCIYFGGTDPGRGLPTALCRAPGDPCFVLTQNQLAAAGYMDYIRGLYGSRIQIPTIGEVEKCVTAYYADIQLRADHDRQFSNEPAQLRPDETVRSQDGKMQVSGTGAVMRVNGLIAKMVFDKNADREFYVEESYPLDWMKPYLTPSGILMKLNRLPQAEIPQEMVDLDHKFWNGFSGRTVGNWITYDTSVKDLCDFCEKVYVRHEESDFKGDVNFLRSQYVQKACSKLRDAIASSIYQWRAEGPGGANSGPETRARMLKEAEFALKQAFAFRPGNQEVVYHFILLLNNQRRWEEERMILKTALELDPTNTFFTPWLKGLNGQSGGTNTGG